MTGQNPIIDLATINDMQTRLAAIEAALGRYNATSAVTAAAATGAAVSSGGTLPPSTAPVASGSTVYVPTQDIIQSNVLSFNLRNVKNGFATGTMTAKFSTPFPSAPIVVATAQGIDATGLPLMLSSTIGNVTADGFQMRVTNLAGASLETVNIQYIATTRK